MHKSKLLDVLKLLHMHELDSLRQYVRLPYKHNRKRQLHLLPLYDYLMRYKNDWAHPDLEKSKVYRAIFGTEEQIKGKLDKLMSNLLRIIYAFLMEEEQNKKQDIMQQKN